MKKLKAKEIKEIALSKGVKPSRKTSDTIKDIQVAEGNVPCFPDRKMFNCSSKGCLWFYNCKNADKDLK